VPGIAHDLHRGAIGIAGSLGPLTRTVESLSLWRPRATDPLTFAGVPLLLVGQALLAFYFGAGASTIVDPWLRCLRIYLGVLSFRFVEGSPWPLLRKLEVFLRISFYLVA